MGLTIHLVKEKIDIRIDFEIEDLPGNCGFSLMYSYSIKFIDKKRDPTRFTFVPYIQSYKEFQQYVPKKIQAKVRKAIRHTLLEFSIRNSYRFDTFGGFILTDNVNRTLYNCLVKHNEKETKSLVQHTKSMGNHGTNISIMLLPGYQHDKLLDNLFDTNKDGWIWSDGDAIQFPFLLGARDD